MRKQAFWALTCFASISSASAAEVSFYTPSDSIISAPDSLTVLKEVEVTDRKADKTVTSTTAMQRLDATRMAQAGVTDISDALRRLAGVNLRDYGGAGGMKTVSVRGLGASHTGVVYDGVALGDSQTGEIDLSRYTLDNLKSISLYAGENDDIFLPARASASSASVYVTTFDLPGVFQDGSHFNVKFKVGAFGLYNPFARYDYNSERLATSLNFEYIHARNNYPFTLKNGDLTTREKRNHSMMNSWKGEGNIKYRFNPASSLSAKLYFYDNSRQLPGPVIYYVSESNEHLKDRNFFGQLTYKGRLSDKLSLSALGKFNWSSTRYEDIGGQYPGGKLDNRYIQREEYLSASLLYLPIDKWAFDYSADWFRNDLTTNKNSKGNIGPFRNSILQTVAAKFSTFRISVMGRLLYSVFLNGAKRGESSKNENKLSPAVSVSVRPFKNQNFFVRASYKNVYRLPTFNEAYFDNYGSLNLHPEETHQFNLGLTYSLETATSLKNLDVTVDGYHNLVRNKIVALPYNMFLWTMSNLGKVKVWGLDATIAANISLARQHSILLTGSYTYQRAGQEGGVNSKNDGRQLAYTPLNSGSASISWLNPWVNIAIRTIGCSSRYTTNANIAETRLGGYFDTGVTVSKTFQLHKISLEGKLELLNIFDKQYEIVARYPMPGRSWSVSLNLNL